jgi:hypothetical protein
LWFLFQSLRSIQREYAALRLVHKETFKENEILKHRVDALEVQVAEYESTSSQHANPSLSSKQLSDADLATLFRRYGKQFTALQEPFPTFFSHPTLLSEPRPSSEWTMPEKRFSTREAREKGWLASLWELIPEQFQVYIPGSIFRCEVS